MSKKRFFWKLYPSFLSLIMLSLAAMGWYATSFFRQFYMDHIQDSLTTQARLLAPQILAYLSPLDGAALDHLCKAAGSGAGTRITVIMPDGTVVGDSDEQPAAMENHRSRPEIEAAYHGRVGTSLRFSPTLEREMMYVAIPLVKADRLAGVLRTAIPVSAIDWGWRRIRRNMTAALALVAFLASLLSLSISQHISRPIEAMKQVAQRFAEGDLDHRLSEPSTAELAGLAVSLNQMAAQMAQRMDDLIRQRNELAAVLASMQEGLIALDEENRMISINQAAAAMIKASPSAVKGRHLEEVIRNREIQQMIQKNRSSSRTIAGDVSLYMPHQRTLHTSITALCDANGDRIGTLLVLNDVTQLRRLENMRRDFAANVSHEIKTPLTAIKGFVETLRTGGLEDPQEALRFLAIIEKHVNRLSAIIDDLIQLSKIEDGQNQQLDTRPSRICEIIANAVALCQPAAQTRRIDIQTACQEGLSARVDPTLLEQAIFNLLENAVKYSRDDSSIRLRVAREGTQVIIEVSDHGIGIAQKHLPRLFERFYRVDKARSRRMGGTGLGLAIVKHIAQAHGGVVAVESRAGVGSTFRLTIPVSGI